jgi:uncharacterized protein YjbI with pentapeptide repeats
VQKFRLATAYEQAGLPIGEIASAIRDCRLSFAFLEGAPWRGGPAAGKSGGVALQEADLRGATLQRANLEGQVWRGRRCKGST